MKKIFYLLVITIFSASLSAQDNWWQGKIIENVEFKGVNNADSSELEGLITPYIGETFSDELFLELHTLVYDLDYFETINPVPLKTDNGNVELIFNVEEYPQISEIIFKGNDSIWKSTLSSKILVKSKDIFSELKINDARDTIISEYINKGYSNVRVETESVIDEEKNSVKVFFNILEGEQRLIKDILFHGNSSVVSDRKLKSIISTKKDNIFVKGVYKESQIQTDILIIEGYYHNRGYINAKVTDHKVTLVDDIKNPDLKHLTLDFFIEEGDKYKYGGISFNGNTLYKTEEFLSLDSQKVGDIYNKGRHESDFIKMMDLYQNNGYVFNSVDNNSVVDEENRVISHEVKIIEKPAAIIGSIGLSGNIKTKDEVLFREIELETGAPFSKEKIHDSIRNLSYTRLFTNIVPNFRRSEDGKMDVVFQVEEESNFEFNGGVNFIGTNFDPSLFLSIADGNFMGMNRTLGGSVDLGKDNQSISLNYSEPRILGSNFAGGGSLSFSHEKEDYEAAIAKNSNDGSTIYFDYAKGYDNKESYDKAVSAGKNLDESDPDLSNLGLSFNLYGSHVWKNSWGIIKAGTGYKTGMETFYLQSEEVPFKEEYRSGEGEWLYNDSWNIWGQVSELDNLTFPTKGYAFTQQLFVGGILPVPDEYSSSDYIKSITAADVYWNFLDKPVTEDWNLKLSLRLHAAYTRILKKPFSDLRVPTNKMITMNELMVGRGWKETANGVALLDLKAEIILPLVPNFVGVTLFFDAANLWTDMEQTTNLNIEDFKFSFGASLGITNRILPISFYMCSTFKVEEGAIVWNPEDHMNFIGDNIKWGVTVNMNQFLR